MTKTDTHHLYELCRRYEQELNEALLAQGVPILDPETVSYRDFVAEWNALPESRREFWRLRFETGYDEIAKADRRKLATAFAASDPSHSVANSVRAA